MKICDRLSPMVEAVELMRLRIGSMDIEEIEYHAQSVLSVISALNEYISSSSRKSAYSLNDALMLVQRLGTHMGRVRLMAESLHMAAQLSQGGRATTSPHRGMVGPGMGRRFGVIRAPLGADNAPSVPLSIPNHEPQACEAGLARGGEAKEDEPRESGEAGL